MKRPAVDYAIIKDNRLVKGSIREEHVGYTNAIIIFKDNEYGIFSVHPEDFQDIIYSHGAVTPIIRGYNRIKPELYETIWTDIMNINTNKLEYVKHLAPHDIPGSLDSLVLQEERNEEHRKLEYVQTPNHFSDES
jgi:hypothetical protein